MILSQKKRQNFKNSMFVVLTFLLHNKSHCSRSQKLNLTHFISGGTPFDEHGLGKYVVSIQSYQGSKIGWNHFCGGSIISSKKILTAAHCLYKRPHVLYKPYEIVVVVGLRHRFTLTSTTQVKDVAFVKTHKAFGRSRTLFADVGFLILKNEIVFTQHRVEKINLPSRKPIANELCIVVGWGKLFDKGPTSDRILFVEVEIFDRSDCKQKYRSSFTAGMLCAGNPQNWDRDSCAGDSGGPLICDGTIMGIVSWGIGCGRAHLPGVYTDVSYFKDWISNALCLKENYLIMILFLYFVLNC